MINVTQKFLSIHLLITLYMFRAHSVHHQERRTVSIQPLVTIILCWWPSCVQVGSRVFFQPAYISATNIEWELPEAVLIQFVSPDDEHCVLETCMRVINKYIERNLCVTLVIYQETCIRSCFEWIIRSTRTNWQYQDPVRSDIFNKAAPHNTDQSGVNSRTTRQCRCSPV